MNKFANISFVILFIITLCWVSWVLGKIFIVDIDQLKIHHLIGLMLVSGLYIGAFYVASHTNTRIVTTTTPIIQVTDGYYATKEHKTLIYHKLPQSYRRTSQK